MKKYVMLLWGLMIAGGWFASCSSDHDDVPSEAAGKSGIRIGLNTDTGFESRAVDESYYKNKDNYTVQILKDGTTVVKEWSKYTDIPDELIELSTGSYVLKAFCGEDKAYSRESMYVVGEEPFTIEQGGQVEEKTVTCSPTCAKVTVAFDSSMDTYFSDYSLMLKTNALGAWVEWTATDTDPCYFRASKEGETMEVRFLLTNKEGYSASMSNKTYTIKAKQALKLTIKPLVQSTDGELGITITIDEGTNDKPVDIVIPAEWMN